MSHDQRQNRAWTDVSPTPRGRCRVHEAHVRRLVIVIGLAVVAATGLAVLSMTGGPSESAPAVAVLRGHGLPADPPPPITRLCNLPVADKWSACPMSSSAALAAGGRVADGTGKSADLVSIRLKHGRTLLAWAVSVVPRTPPPAPDSAATFLVLLDGHTGDLSTCQDFDYGGPYPKSPPPANILVWACTGGAAVTAEIIGGADGGKGGITFRICRQLDPVLG
jgi:hypothetical protein